MRLFRYCRILLLTFAFVLVPAPIMLSADSKIYYVGEKGDYQTISEAVAVAEAGSVIFVQSGTYNESVRVKKNISIIGEDCDRVILQYPCTYYHKPPLEAYCGRFKNMTIRATADETGYNGTHAYAVHCEKSAVKAGKSIIFSNCRFESVGNWDVGMGSCDGFTATFSHCIFSNLGMFYHTYGKYTGLPSKTTLNLDHCTFSPRSSVTIRNCFANTSVLSVNLYSTVFPTEGSLIVVGSADASGKPLLDANFKYYAKNIIWNQHD